jgi:hypothetical protein
VNIRKSNIERDIKSQLNYLTNEKKLSINRRSAINILEYKNLVHISTWKEKRLDKSGSEIWIEVSGEIWTEAINEAIRNSKYVYIPARDKPYYLDNPIILYSGNVLEADTAAELRLKPGTNTCMVRNNNIVDGQKMDVQTNSKPDSNIVIIGGKWTTLCVRKGIDNGNYLGRSSKTDFINGTNGVFMLSNISGLKISKLLLFEYRPFGIHLSNCKNFIVQDIRFLKADKDGVHINGPSSFGLIKNISGHSSDDLIALNAWDWKGSAPTFGSIHHIQIENIKTKFNPIRPKTMRLFPGYNTVRLLPGVKEFENGSKLNCPVNNIILRNVNDIGEFHLYGQPNLDLAVKGIKDFSAGMGLLSNIYFDNLTYNIPGKIQIATNIDGLFINNVHYNFNTDKDFYSMDTDTCCKVFKDIKLVEIGPKSLTYKRTNDPANWIEVYLPDSNITVRNFSLSNVTYKTAKGVKKIETPTDKMIILKNQTLNHDYPRTTPKGGTGKVFFYPRIGIPDLEPNNSDYR